MNDAELIAQIRTKRARLLGHDQLSPKEWQAAMGLFQAEFAITGVTAETFDWSIFQ